MIAHIIFETVDSKPAGFSRIWLQDILRKRLGFKGVIFSDDLNMEGANISTSYSDRVQEARDAGCDFTLLCNNHPGVIKVLDEVQYQKQLIDIEKWGELKAKFTPSMKAYRDSHRWQLITASLNSYI